MMELQKKHIWFLRITILLFVISYLFFLPQDVMDIDSTQYAEIAREMIENKNFLSLKDNGRKYLDKPIMTFWIISFFYSLFGISNFSYRLPATFMLLISLFGIYKITKLTYQDKQKAWIATLFYASSPAVFSMLTSPIIDIYLTTFLILTFLFYYYGIHEDPKYLYLMYLFIGIGFITKGPISLVIPLLSIFGNHLLKKDFETLKKIKLFSGFLIVFLIVGFWSFLLYLDFGIYGPYFFLYLQSFGRITSKFYDTGWDPFYFYYTFLFSILPFGLFFVLITFQKLKEIYKNFQISYLENKRFNEFYDFLFQKDRVLYLWCFLILFLLSFSKFRLPQYVFWLVPPASILSAHWFVESIHSKKHHSFWVVPFFLIVFLVYFRFFSEIEFHIVFSIFLLISIVILIYFHQVYSLGIRFTFITVLLVYVYGITSIYPFLVEYQPASKMAKLIPPKKDSKEILFTYGIPYSHRSYAFYTQRLTRALEIKKELFYQHLQNYQEAYIVVHYQLYEVFKNDFKDVELHELGKFPFYKVSRPTWDFFEPKKRESKLQYVYLIKAIK
ncbi:MAG: glycosyltransferase family 39 protein [Leptospiraceae bacterium]|nr:glycosyltransferase family 39 protein [Leptospiraceae bacterium]